MTWQHLLNDVASIRQVVNDVASIHHLVTRHHHLVNDVVFVDYLIC